MWRWRKHPPGPLHKGEWVLMWSCAKIPKRAARPKSQRPQAVQITNVPKPPQNVPKPLPVSPNRRRMSGGRRSRGDRLGMLVSRPAAAC